MDARAGNRSPRIPPAGLAILKRRPYGHEARDKLNDARTTVIDPADADASTLVEALVSVVLSDIAQRQHGRRGEASDVILDLEVRGIRCVLSRVPQSSRATEPQLSRRQVEIATMIADGLTNREIASTLQISQWTVATHIRHIFAKLGVSTRAAMVARVLERRERT
jgi:DNA-binding NarL/FixJ family response regulator